MKLRDTLRKRGASGHIGLARNFKIMDNNGNRQLDKYEFHAAMHDFNLGFNKAEI